MICAALFLSAIGLVAGQEPEEILSELDAALSGELELPLTRLSEVFQRLADWEYSDGYEGPPRIELRRRLRDLYRRESERDPGARQYAAICDYYLAQLIERELGREEAIASLREAVAYNERLGPTMPLNLAVLAGMERDEGFYRSALGHLDEAQEILALQRERGLASQGETVELMLLSEYAAAYLGMGMADLAGPLLRDLTERAVAIGDMPLWVRAILYRMYLAVESDDFEELRRTFEEFEAHELNAEVLDEERSQVLGRLAWGQTKEEFYGWAEPDEAEQTFRLALAIEAVKPDERVKLKTRLAMNLLDRGLLERARETLTEAFDEHPGDPLVDPPPYVVDAHALWARLALEDPATRPEDLAPLLERRLQPAFESLLQNWSRVPVREGGVSYLQFGRRHSLLSELIRLELAVHGDVDGARRALRHVLRAQGLGTLARTNEIGVPTLERVESELLEPGSGVLCFVVGRRGCHVLAWDRDACTHHALAPAHAIQAAASSLMGAAQGALHDAADGPSRAHLQSAVARATSALLPDELRARIEGWDSIAAVGLDAFGYVPLEALEPQGGPLGERKAISYWPSVPVETWLEARAAAEVEREFAGLVLLGAGEPAAGIQGIAAGPGLRFDEAQAAAILAPYSSSPGALFSARASNAGDLEGGSFAGLGFVQFMTHGVFVGQRERPAGLLLAPAAGLDGVLFAEQVEALASVPAVVALTACGTGKTRLRRGDDGRGSLGGAFFQAGSRSVLLTYSDLELGAIADLSTCFHRHAARGERLDRALMLARRDARPGRYGVHPVHSSMLHLLGSARPVVRIAEAGAREPRPADGSRAANPLAWAALAVGALLAIAAATRSWRLRARS